MVSELLRARLRLLVLTAVAAGLAGCSSEATRFNDNRYSDNRYSPRPSASVEPTSATAMAPVGGIEQTSLPPPSGASVPPAPETGVRGGCPSSGMAIYQPTPSPPPPEIPGSTTPRKPNSPGSREGATAIIAAPGETIDIIAHRHGIPATALIEA